jgi:hypothetical protein
LTLSDGSRHRGIMSRCLRSPAMGSVIFSSVRHAGGAVLFFLFFFPCFYLCDDALACWLIGKV